MSLNVAVGPILCLVLGIAFSFVNVPLAATYQGGLPADARGNGMAARNFSDYIVTTLLAGALFLLTKFMGLSATGQFLLLTILTGVMAGVSIRLLYVEVIEMMFELMIGPFYRISARARAGMLCRRKVP